MDEDFGGTYITIEDEDGNNIELEIIAEMEYNGKSYTLFLPGEESMDEDDPDYGYIILRNEYEENGEFVYESVDGEAELNEIYERFMALLFDEEGDIKQ